MLVVIKDCDLMCRDRHRRREREREKMGRERERAYYIKYWDGMKKESKEEEERTACA